MTTLSTALPGMGINQKQGVIADQQHLKGMGIGAEQGVNTGSQILKGSSSAGGPNDVQVETSVVQTSSVGAVGASQKTGTTKVCRRCGVKGHLMFECTTMVFCEICRSSDHAMSRCPILKQPKPVAQLVGQAADALASFLIPHAPIQPTKRESRMALIFTSGKDLSEEDVAAFLRVLVSDTFAWEVKRHNSSEFKVLFPTKGDLAKIMQK